MSENSRNSTVGTPLRFPCKQEEYTHTVGKVLPTILEEVFTELGFRVKVNHQQTNGVDLEVFLEDNLVLVAEVVNWWISSRLTDKRKNGYIRNLSEYSCSKVFIHTVPLSNLDGFAEHGIHLLRIGYQVLPQNYYSYFQQLNKVECREVDSEPVRRDITSKIREFVDNNLFAHKYFRLLIS